MDLIKSVARLGFAIGSDDSAVNIKEEIDQIIKLIDPDYGKIREAFYFCLGAGTVNEKFESVWSIYETYKNEKASEIAPTISKASNK